MVTTICTLPFTANVLNEPNPSFVTRSASVTEESKHIIQGGDTLVESSRRHGRREIERERQAHKRARETYLKKRYKTFSLSVIS